MSEKALLYRAPLRVKRQAILSQWDRKLRDNTSVIPELLTEFHRVSNLIATNKVAIQRAYNMGDFFQYHMLHADMDGDITIQNRLRNKLKFLRAI